MTNPYVIPEQLDKARTFWLEMARKHKWAGPLEPFHVQVWVDEAGNVVDSVSFNGMTQDYILRQDGEEDEPCRECGEDASEDDRPMKDDALCWDCYRDIYGEEGE